MTTALLGTAPLLLPPAPAMAQVFLDNVNTADGLVNPGNGAWSAGSPIWSDSDGDDHGALATGGFGVLRTDPVGGPSAVALTVSGRVLPGRLRVDGGSFTLTGGIIGQSGRDWTLEVGSGLTLAVGSSIEGDLDVEGPGQVLFTGDGSGLDSIQVEAGATLESSGVTAGLLESDGDVTLTGTHDGDVGIGDAGTLRGNATINGRIDNAGNAIFAGTIDRLRNAGSFTTAGNLSVDTLGNVADAQFVLRSSDTLTARGNQITNEGVMRLAGTVDIPDSDNTDNRLLNTGNGVLRLNGATINGNVGNNTDGRLELAGTTLVRGDLRTRGTVVVDDAAAVVLQLEGTFTFIAGEIQRIGSGALSIIADALLFEEEAVFDNAVAALTGAITNQGRFTVSTAMTLTATLRNALAPDDDPGIMTLTAALNGGGNAIDNDGDLRIEAGGSIANVTAIDNAGTIRTDAGTSIAANVTLRDDATLTHAGTLTGTLQVQDGAVATLTGGTVTGAVSNNGRLAGRGTISGTLTNNAGGEVQATGALTTGGLVNSGSVEIAGTGSLSNAGSLTNRGLIEAGGSLTLTGVGAVLTNAADAELVLAGGAINAAIVNNAGGEIRVTANTTVNGGVTNNGLFRMPVLLRTITLNVVGGTFTNTGTIRADGPLDRLRIVADQIILTADSVVTGPITFIGEVLNAGDLVFTEDTTLTGNLVNQADGTSLVMADVNANGFDVSNAGVMTVRTSPRGTLTGIDALTNSGDFTVEDRATVSAANIANRAGGDLLVQGGLTGPVTNAAGGTVSLDGGTITGTVANAGTLTGNGRITGALDNDGVATIAGQAGAVDNSGTLTTTGDLTVASLANSNRVTVAGGHRLTAGAPIQNGATMIVAGIVQGRVDNGAGAALALTGGTITGAVDNQGTMTARGTVGGTLTNADSLTTTGDLSVGSLANAGTATVGADHVLTADGGVSNTGTVQVNGTLRGTLDNQATATLAQDSRVEGAVRNSGTLTGRGTITGVVTNSGTATLGGSTGDLTNTATGTLGTTGVLEVGQLANSGTIAIAASERLSARDGVDNRGTIDLRGALRASGGTVLNRDTGVIALDGATITGTTINDGLLDIRSDSSFVGDLSNRGTMDSTGGAADVLVTVRDGTFRNSGTVQVSGAGNLTIQADNIVLDETSTVDNTRVSLIGALANEGTLIFRRDASLTGDLVNAPSGTVTVAADLDAAGNDVSNSGDFRVGAPLGSLTDVGTLTNDGRFVIGADGRVGADAAINRDGGQMTVAGTLAAAVQNDAGGTLRATGILSGSLTNRGTAVLAGSVQAVDNAGTLQTGGDLSAASLNNDGTVGVGAGHVLTTGRAVANAGTMRVDGTLRGGVRNTGTLSGDGAITGSMNNGGRLVWTGTVGGTLTTSNSADLAGTVGGDLRNTGIADTTGDLTVTGALVNAAEGADPAAFTVVRGTVLTVAGPITNQAGSVLRNNGTVAGDIANAGSYLQSGLLAGSLVTRGSANLAGRVTGDVSFDGGSLTLADGAIIGGTLGLGQDFGVAAGRTLAVARTTVAEGVRFSLAGRMNGAVGNAGTLVAQGRGARIDGTLTNTGAVDLTGDRDSTGRLQVGGLSGDGEYRLDVNLTDMTADRIVVESGAATGNYALVLNQLSGTTVGEIGRRVTLIDVDESQGSANSYSFDPVGISVGSERIIYDLARQSRWGDLQIVSVVNPAIGALAGNVSLTQTLIDSVVNRPSSPFVTGLAFDDAEKPCGIGAWGRATGGTADSSGAFTVNGDTLTSGVSATYYGMQVGSDLACFDDRHAGWDLAMGVLAGVNHGDATQPVYTTLQDAARLTSVNKTEFTQAYGGVYMTATKNRWQADLQVRGEQTDFTISNRSLVGGVGLGLSDADFKSTSQTVSGSVSYAIPVGEGGWTVVPTGGFAWSRIKTDDLRFDIIDEDITETLQFEDAERAIGFAGATVARSYVQPSENSALQVFATGTVYHDFADPSVSIFTRTGDDLIDPQRIESENLGTYGEFSIGANFIQVLGERSRARQFSTSARIDARFGDSLDSVGVTGQVRWQF